jgi:succinate dehydrogenase/fumarate reductase flavoprotein subunit
VDKEKARAYAPLAAKPHALGWKELNAGICRVMQDNCGAFRSGRTLEAGARLLREIAEGEAARTHAANPHELVRVLECLSLLEAGQAVMHASLARRASSALLDFRRIDFPASDPPEWRKLLPISREGDGAKVRELALDWHLVSPYAGTCEENYRLRVPQGGTAR